MEDKSRYKLTDFVIPVVGILDYARRNKDSYVKPFGNLSKFTSYEIREKILWGWHIVYCAAILVGLEKLLN